MDSINFSLPTLSPQRILTIRSVSMEKLINLKNPLSAAHLSPLFPAINNILPDAKLKEQIMHDYFREG